LTAPPSGGVSSFVRTIRSAQFRAAYVRLCTYFPRGRKVHHGQ
jgi:hypothetical protein